MTRRHLIPSLLILACGPNDGGDNPFGAGGTGGSGDGTAGSATAGPTASTATTEGGDEAPGDGGSDSATGAALFDVGMGEDTAGAEQGDDDGCKKIDFLFVIDNSFSMEPHQSSLIAAFPDFVDSILDAVPPQDGHHVMIIDSDGVPAISSHQNLCDMDRSCGGASHFSGCETYPCGTIAQLEGCDVTVGAGITAAWGRGASNEECGFPPDRRWLSTSDADLTDAFACAAQLGIGGYGQEAVMGSLTEALGSQAGQCNEGFLRDDALLVLTVVSNSATTSDNNLLKVDGTPEGAFNQDGPQGWYDAVVAAKGGNAQAVVAIGLFAQSGCADFTDNYSAFVELFGTNSLTGDACEADYGSLFAEGVSIIDSACDAFEPEG